ncbi:MAG: class I SAM-dependent methyltransferase [Flavobacteriales bacterium]|nr:class I SAM-dependent methyltransferase [Flavobacteriales bacterium]
MNADSIEQFYDDYVDRQIKMGINARHFSIADLLIKYGLKKGDSVLEIGCGVGTVTYLISKIVKTGFIHANDLSDKSVQASKKRLSFYKNIEFSSGDFIFQNINRKFDWIVLPDVLEHIPIENHPRLFEKIEDSLAENGKVFIHIPQPDYLEWVINNKPELLQEIDQPIFLDGLLSSLSETGLHLIKMKDYSLYVAPYDYRIIVLEKKYKGNYPSSGLKPHGFFKKVIYKIKYR